MNNLELLSVIITGLLLLLRLIVEWDLITNSAAARWIKRFIPRWLIILLAGVTIGVVLGWFAANWV